jgi:tRNA threonylcarbamoyladenosine biosynthesis protein TsaE
MSVDLKLPDAQATERLGAALAPAIGPGRVLHLTGELGTGKTTLVRGLLRALGFTGRVKSPTYAWVEPYELSRLHLYHFDFFRFDDRSEWLSSGLRDYFGPHSACIVEWPERLGTVLPPPDLAILLSHEGAARRARVEGRTPAGRAWLSSLSLP